MASTHISSFWIQINLWDLSSSFFNQNREICIIERCIYDKQQNHILLLSGVFKQNRQLLICKKQGLRMSLDKISYNFLQLYIMK
jgi:hypothetical protein